MLNLIKYELRRNMGSLIILYAIIGILEIFSLFSMFTKNNSLTAVSLSLIFIAGIISIFYVFIIAITSYSKELSSKESYMIFMTPNSTYKIMASKLLTTALIALITTIVAILLVVIDYNVFMSQYTDIAKNSQLFSEMLKEAGYDLNEFVIIIFVSFIVQWINIFTSICFAYLAITLSSTLLANKKFKGIISFVFFIVISLVVSKIGGLFPELGINGSNEVVTELLNFLPTYIFHIIAMIAAFIGASVLLEKKVDL